MTGALGLLISPHPLSPWLPLQTPAALLSDFHFRSAALLMQQEDLGENSGREGGWDSLQGVPQSPHLVIIPSSTRQLSRLD